MFPLPPWTEVAPARRAFTLLDEFKNFAFRGNVIDLAVGVIIGAAFTKIVESLVSKVLMPLIGFLMPGDMGFQNWKLDLGGGKVLPYGEFLADVVNFLLVALVLFVFIVKFLGWVLSFHKAEAAAAAAAPPLTKEQELLTEIRDLLKNAQTKA